MTTISVVSQTAMHVAANCACDVADCASSQAKRFDRVFRCLHMRTRRESVLVFMDVYVLRVRPQHRRRSTNTLRNGYMPSRADLLKTGPACTRAETLARRPLECEAQNSSHPHTSRSESLPRFHPAEPGRPRSVHCPPNFVKQAPMRFRGTEFNTSTFSSTCVQ